MENLEIVTENSVTGHESIKVVSSVDSSTGMSSPARSGIPTSPSAASHSTHPTYQQPSSVDLLDNQSAQLSQAYSSSRVRSNGLASSDDDHTEPSSATGNYSSGDNPGYTRSDFNTNPTSTFGRLVENTKKRLNASDRRRNSADDDEEGAMEGVLICGYLQKLGRNGKWQTRWFETDGECLTYYKSSKRSNVLATLDLAKVGSISINRQDTSGTSFTISISDRAYRLRADSEPACKDWVITLNRVKEARMHEGNVKLSVPSTGPLDILKHHNNFTPRVVVVANRQRTRAIDDDDMQPWENSPFGNDPAIEGGNFLAQHSGRLARWQKPHNSLSRLASKLAKWARSIRKIGCTDAEDHVVLDHHLHPPGHDDKKKQSTPSGQKSGSKVALSADRSADPEDGPAPAQELQHHDDDDDDGARYLS